MPLFEGSKRIPNSRSHTRLVVSGGDAPAEKWIADPRLPSLMEYDYGGPGQVVITKGTIVALGPKFKDFQSQKYVDSVTIADGQNNIPIGIVPFNVYQRVKEDPDTGEPIAVATGDRIDDYDKFNRNQPTVVTREYIEVPMIPNPADAAEIKWGLLTNSQTDWDANELVKPGDYLMPNADGKFVKWDGTDPRQIVGQLLATEVDMPPTGWLKWVTPEVEKYSFDNGGSGQRAEMEADMAPLDGSGYEADPNFRMPLTSDYRAPGAWKEYRGIPGLTDGAEMAKTDRIERFAYNDGAEPNTAQLMKTAKIDRETVVVTLVDTDGVEADVVLTNDDTQTDYYTLSDNNELTVNTATAFAAYDEIRVEYKQSKIAGIMPGWDFEGSVGAARILLKL